MRASSVLWRALPFSLVLFGCGSETNAPTIVRPDPPKAASIKIVSGDDQEAKVGLPLAPFVIEALDAQGGVVSGVGIAWEVTGPGGQLSRQSWYTDDHGLASAWFTPMAFGRTVVTVRAVGEPTPVTFTIEPNTLVISYVNDAPYYGDPGPIHVFVSSACIDPLNCGVAKVPVGTAVEWMSDWYWGFPEREWSVTSISVPPGGAAFNSGMLGESDRFRFVPRVAGTWSYVDQKYGAKGTLIAY